MAFITGVKISNSTKQSDED